MPAPHPVFWYLQIAVGEYSHLVALACIPVFISRKPGPEMAVALLVMVLSVWPWYSAYKIAEQLPARLQEAFGTAAAGSPLARVATPALEPVTEEYKPGQVWDRFSPAGQPRPLSILVVHGGSWRGGSRQTFRAFNRHLASLGYPVYTIDYRLAPEHPYPAAREDVAAAVAKIEGPLVLVGRSAGGHLALLAAELESVVGVVAFYPPVDMNWSHEHPSNPRVLDSTSAIEAFMEGPPSARPERYREASPLQQVDPDWPPVLLIHGDHDDLVYVRQAEMLAEKLAANNIPHLLLRPWWATHGSDYPSNGPTGKLSSYAVRSFLESLETCSSFAR